MTIYRYNLHKNRKLMRCYGEIEGAGQEEERWKRAERLVIEASCSLISEVKKCGEVTD